MKPICIILNVIIRTLTNIPAWIIYILYLSYLEGGCHDEGGGDLAAGAHNVVGHQDHVQHGQAHHRVPEQMLLVNLILQTVIRNI